MRLTKIGYLFKEGFKSIFTHGFMSFASVTIIIACLIIMGSFALLAVNIDAIIQEAEDDNEVVAFVDESLTDEEAMDLGKSIRILSNVSDAVFVSRDEAMEDWILTSENPEIFEGIEAEVFRHRYVVSLEDIALIETTRNDLYGIPGVASVRADIDVAKGFVTARNVMSALSIILVVILMVVSMFIMSNTIKLASFGRREEIAIMKMVGASNTFIRTPFVVEGLVLGLVGSGVAFLAQWGIYKFVTERVMASIAGGFVTVLPFSGLWLPVLLVFMVIGFFVGAFGGVVAIRNYLKV